MEIVPKASLCIILVSVVEQVIPEDGKKRTASYYVNLCRPLLPMPGINCPAGAWACKVWTDGLKNQQYQVKCKRTR